MTEITHHKLATTAYLYFYYINRSTGAPVTGKVAGDFTKQVTKNGTGNQSTTGLTGPTEVDATNNAGLYVITCASNSFVAATGQYEIKVFLTADNTSVWNGALFVTNDGTGAGSWGDASFVPTASDGRIMSGGSPLSGATVRILDSSNNVYVQTTSDASGLWPRVYFPSGTATYTISVQKTGYTTTTGTITVASSVATGPATDLSITASSTASTLLVSTLMAYTRRVMLDASGTKSDTIIMEIINEAAEMISMERQQEYYLERGVIDLQAAYSTGTITLTNNSTTVTGSGTTFPTWAGSGEIYVDGTWLAVETYTSGTSLVLAEAWQGDTTSGLTYVLAQVRYALPADCARTFDLQLGPEWPYPPTAISAAEIEILRDRWQTGSTNPSAWAIEKNFVFVWPYPTEKKRVNFLYLRKPTQVTSASDTLDFPADQLLLLRKAIDYLAAMRGSTTVGSIDQARKIYDEALIKALPWDKTTADARTMLPTSSGMSYDPLRGTVS